MPGVLEGIRVIDFGQYIAGPMAAMLLGDQGADVIRIDPPGGPRWNTPANATWNRNKRSIVLDLKKDADRETARQLIAGADVVIENFRPGVMDRLGLGAAAMTAANPRLIYCSLPGFGSDDPRAQVKAWEGVVGAATGAYRASHATKGRPVYTVIPYGSAYAAFLCAVTVAMALNARERSGLGQRVEIPLFDATFTVVGARGLLVNGKPVPEPEFNWSRQLPCKDGRWLMYVANNKKFEAFIKSIGMDKWRDAKLPPKELAQKFDEVMRTRTAKEWEDIIAEIGSEGVICHTSAEWLKHPQALESKIIADYDDPELGRFRGPGINARLSATPGSVRTPRPKTDAHRAEILKELARTPAPVRPERGQWGRRAKRPKSCARRSQGVKVVDLCIVLAGPTCGRTLAEFGADVIKIDSPHTKHRAAAQRHQPRQAQRPHRPEDERGAGDLLEAGGSGRRGAAEFPRRRRREARHRLRAGARAPAGHRLRLHEYLRPASVPTPAVPATSRSARRCRACRCATARPSPPPRLSPRTTTAPASWPAMPWRSPCCTGAAPEKDSSWTARSPTRQPCCNRRCCRITKARSGTNRTARRRRAAGRSTAFIRRATAGCSSRHGAGELARCAELADLAGRSGADLERALEERMRSRSVAAWVDVLNKAGIGAHRVVPSLVELMTDPLVQARGLAVTRDHEGFGPITTTAPGVKLSRTPVTVGRPAAKPGSDAASVLAEIGMGGELERLIREGVIAVDGVKAGC